MKSRHYFELKLTDHFERRFQHCNAGEYVVKYTPIDCDCYNVNDGGIFIIEFKSRFPLFVKLKLYETDVISCDDRCIFTHCSVLQNHKMKLEADLQDTDYYFGPQPIICSVEIIRYEKWQNIQSLPMSNVESKHYFELKLDDNFKRRFQQFNIGEYMVKYTGIGSQCQSGNSGIFSIDFNSGISLFVELKLYEMDNFACNDSYIFSHSSAVRSPKMKFEANLNHCYKSSSALYICSVQIIQYEKWKNFQSHPISVMESKHYFGLNITDNFERKFQQLNIGEYLVKYSFNKSRCSNNDNGGIFTIEFKRGAPLLVTFKVYGIINTEGDCKGVFYHSVVFQSRKMKFEVDLNKIYCEYRSESYICSVQIIQYEKYKRFQDSAKNVIGNNGPVIESNLLHLASDMRRLLAQGEFSDVIVSDGITDFRVHKLVLSTRSSVFSKMFQDSVKENRFIIPDVHSEVLKELLSFIYSGIVTIKDMKMARDLYEAAHKYDMKELSTMCSKNLENMNLDSVLDTLALANLYKDETLKQTALNFISENYSELKRHKRWNSFIKENQVLAVEILSFALDERS